MFLSLRVETPFFTEPSHALAEGLPGVVLSGYGAIRPEAPGNVGPAQPLPLEVPGLTGERRVQTACALRRAGRLGCFAGPSWLADWA